MEEGWLQTLEDRLLSIFEGDDELTQEIKRALNDQTHPAGIHIAVFSEPFLSFLLEGKKKLDSRFSARRRAPYRQVAEGDYVLVKESGGPIRAICQLGQVWFYEIDKDSWEHLKGEYSEALCVMDPQFWEEKKNASYGTLMQLKLVHKIDPFGIDKSDRRSWVVVRSAILEDAFNEI